jgi:hypothetical protein
MFPTEITAHGALVVFAYSLILGVGYTLGAWIVTRLLK